MKNKKIGLIALAMVAVGALGSVAVQSFAQTTPSTTQNEVVSVQDSGKSQELLGQDKPDAKDVNGKDLEENDDSVGSQDKADVKDLNGNDVETNDGPNGANN